MKIIYIDLRNNPPLNSTQKQKMYPEIFAEFMHFDKCMTHIFKTETVDEASVV